MNPLNQVKKLVFEYINPNDASIYLFGSYATGLASSSSDIDIAIEPKPSLNEQALSQLKEALEESTIAQKVDIINLNDVSETFKKTVLKEGIIWKKSSKN